MSDPIPSQKFTGYWIPQELDKLNLSRSEQFLLAMIDSLEQDAPDYCFASNAYLAKKMQLSESRISFYITRLKRMNLIEQVSFDGTKRRLKVLKHNWYKSENSNNNLCVKTISPHGKSKNSKKDVCVKTRGQTTWKQEGRLRENTHHISKNIEKNKESINRDSIPSRSEDISIVDPPEKIFEFKNKLSKFLSPFRAKIVDRWIAKYGIERLARNLKLFSDENKLGKNPILNLEAWMETALKKDTAKIRKTEDINKKFAENLKKKYNIGSLKISQRYCLDDEKGKDYIYSLPEEQFKRNLYELYEIVEEKYG